MTPELHREVLALLASDQRQRFLIDLSRELILRQRSHYAHGDAPRINAIRWCNETMLRVGTQLYQTEIDGGPDSIHGYPDHVFLDVLENTATLFGDFRRELESTVNAAAQWTRGEIPDAL